MAFYGFGLLRLHLNVNVNACGHLQPGQHLNGLWIGSDDINKPLVSPLLKLLSGILILVNSSQNCNNFLMNLLAAMGAYCFFATKPEVNFDFEVPESNGQLVLWD